MRTTLLLLLVATICSPILSQENDIPTSLTHLRAGLSIGTGFSFDVGVGNIKYYTVRPDIGWEASASVWSPKFSSDEPKGEEGHFSWLYKTDVTEKFKGWSIGGRIFYNKLSFGIFLDNLTTTKYQNYKSSATGWDWHTPGVDEKQYSISLAVGYRLGAVGEANVCVGGLRGVMVGIAMLMTSPNF